MSALRVMVQAVILAGGVLAMVMLGSASSPRPWVCLVQVEGNSMRPALPPGSEVLVSRVPFRLHSIVLADVGENEVIVKRVVGFCGKQVLLQGDNRQCSSDYCVSAQAILGRMICRLPFGSPLRPERPGPLWARLGIQGYGGDLE